VENFFLVLVVLLLALAVFDLIVGVSNDAVNFLTSAVGAKAGSFKLIMTVATIGIFVGAVSAGGMMEIARKGLFFPNKFTFQDVVFIYVVVMLSDVLLLDVFNSLKLPTSTTVSIVFELLGASMAISMLNMYQQEVPLSEWGDYINSTKAIKKIVAIFISVVLAFLAGWLVQFIMRSIVTFEYERFKRIGGSIFGGISVVIVVNFIINVAFKNSPLKSADMVVWLIDHFWLVGAMVFTISSAIFYVLASGKFDPFRFITLLGTFALAMAFASNDLVNFIGVPVASFDAFELWRASGQPADAFYMDAFMEQGLPANQLFLVLAGLIMAVTLWLSKKARNVIQTSVNLSRQRDGVERFQANTAVRLVVKGVSGFANAVVKVIPDPVVTTIENRFHRKPVMELGQSDAPAFDMVRASTNLMIAALVISLGTAYKLPLSTTYVSFMVLMGTSLADRAWNRDSAVYRVSGVFTVIGGWFVTALAALSISMFFAYIVFTYQFVGVGVVLIMVVGGIILVNRLTNNKEQVPFTPSLPSNWFDQDIHQIKKYLGERTDDLFDFYGTFVDDIHVALSNENGKELVTHKRHFEKLQEENAAYLVTLSDQLALLQDEHKGKGHLLVAYFNLESQLMQLLHGLTDVASTHVLNMHKPLDGYQLDQIKTLNDSVHRYLANFKRALHASEIEQVSMSQLNDSIYASIELQIDGLINERYNYKNSLMYFTYLYRLRDSMSVLNELQYLSQ